MVLNSITLPSECQNVTCDLGKQLQGEMLGILTTSPPLQLPTPPYSKIRFTGGREMSDDDVLINVFNQFDFIKLKSNPAVTG